MNGLIRLILIVVIIVGAGMFLWPRFQESQLDKDCPSDGCKPAKPKPKPRPRRPNPRPRPWDKISLAVGKISEGGNISPMGDEVQVDYPDSEWFKNIGGRDGAGMCVMTSIEYALRWQNREEFRGLRDWCARDTGGGWPERVDKQLKQWADAKGITLRYIQYQGKDTSILKLALKTGRMIAVTYSGRDGVRYRGSIAHMVTCVHFTDDEVGILDNNAKPILWMSPHEFIDRWVSGGNGWAVIPLYSPPPLPPSNSFKIEQSVVDSKPLKAAVYTSKTREHKDYRWGPIDGYGNYWLYYQDKCIGMYQPPTGWYWRWSSNGWGTRTDPPISPPGTELTGVVRSNIGKREVYAAAGREITRGQAFELIRQDSLIDDSAYLRVTVIGPKDKRDAVVKDMARSPELREWRNKVHLQSYPANHWAVKDCGFVTDGKPTIYVQLGAKVLHRQDEYTGATDLATALRKADPNYRPGKDPDLTRQPQPLSLPFDLSKLLGLFGGWNTSDLGLAGTAIGIILWMLGLGRRRD